MRRTATNGNRERDDSHLIRGAQDDPAAFDALYRRYVDRIYNYIFHRVGTVEDAEDLTARTFHRALVSLGSYDDRGAPLSAWLYRIAHNLVANWHRDEARRKGIPLDLVDPVAGSHDTPDDAAFAQQQVRSAIRRLRPDRQDLLVLKFSEGLSNAEIGLILGKSEGAIKSLYHRTLLELREQLSDFLTADAESGDIER